MTLGDFMVRIWSYEHDAWWAVDSCGYVRDIERAGLYPRQRAEEIVAAIVELSDMPKRGIK